MLCCLYCCVVLLFFFFKQKTAYEMRISDWSSDVCSSDLDVGCHWCDVKESWNADTHPLTAADTIIGHAQQHPSKAVVVTGGEPLLYNLDYLTSGLQAAGIQTFIETSGAYPLSGNWDWVCLSPKKFKSPLPDVIAAAGEIGRAHV